MAGNYMVRNTAFARDFLMRWALYYDRKPQGFSSSDNGAIQLVVMETIKVEGFDTCYDMYRKLTESVRGSRVNGLTSRPVAAQVTNLKPYWDYVHCTKEAIGPARAWKMEGGSLTMWPRLEFFAADGVFLNRWASDEVGPIMHHGVKDPNDVTSFYYKDLDKCELNRSSVIRSAEQLGETALHLAQSYPEYFPAGRSCKQCAEHCMKSFSCEPLEDAEQPRPRQVVSSGPSTFVLEDSPEHLARKSRRRRSLEERGLGRSDCDQGVMDLCHLVADRVSSDPPRRPGLDAEVNYGCKSNPHQMGGSGGNFVLRSARVIPQPGDGNCLYHSMSYGLRNCTAASLRRELADFLRHNPSLQIAGDSLEEWVRWDSNSAVNEYTRRQAVTGWGGGIEMARPDRF
ncbi:unnamed protein product [Effrenium voratum]|nr:unnamed protein product [Effrenium voratum]